MISNNKSVEDSAEELRRLLKEASKVGGVLMNQGYSLDYRIEYDTMNLSVDIFKTHKESI